MRGGFPLWSMASIAKEGQEPLRDWISLSVIFCFALSRSGRKPYLIFPEIRNSDCADIFTLFFPDISFLVPKVEIQPTFEEGTIHQGTPRPGGVPQWVVVPSGLRFGDSNSQKSQIFQNNSPWSCITFGLCLIWIFYDTKTGNKQELALGTG